MPKPPQEAAPAKKRARRSLRAPWPGEPNLLDAWLHFNARKEKSLRSTRTPFAAPHSDDISKK
jgi:hypothetical protein